MTSSIYFRHHFAFWSFVALFLQNGTVNFNPNLLRRYQSDTYKSSTREAVI